MFKIVRRSEHLELGAMVGIDPSSDGLARAKRMGVPTTHEGVEGLLAMPEFEQIEIVLDATSAQAHKHNAGLLAESGRRLVDLTPAAIGPFVVPVVNLDEHLDAPNVNMVTCGGQATIPIVAAVARVAPVPYAEIVASVASCSAGPGTRANIDEFTETTAHAVEAVGGAGRGKAIIILNPAEPPLIMRDTVYCLIGDADHDEVKRSVVQMIADVSRYVPGYRLKQDVQITPIDPAAIATLTPDADSVAWKVTTFLEVEGAADYLPPYAGNLDIMTSAAMRVAEQISLRERTGAAR
jgi:acetaldehyde dehydrogenase